MTADDEVMPLAVESLDSAAPPPARSVVLSKEQAGEVLDYVGGATRAGAGIFARRRAAKGLYRVVPRGDLAEGLKKHGYRYATPSSGDTSVQVMDASGNFAGRADLKAVKPSVMKLVGPAAWQAMAMATQQHYLVEISGKLSAIDSKLDELIARDEDKKLSAFKKARTLATEAQDTMAAGKRLSPDRVKELGLHMHRVDDEWRELLHRTERLLKPYRAGGSNTDKRKSKAASDVNASWSLLLRATQALAEASTAFAALPQDDADIAEALRREESERVAGCLSCPR